MGLALPPSASITQISCPPVRLEENAIRLPSGEYCALTLRPVAGVNRRHGPLTRADPFRSPSHRLTSIMGFHISQAVATDGSAGIEGIVKSEVDHRAFPIEIQPKGFPGHERWRELAPCHRATWLASHLRVFNRKALQAVSRRSSRTRRDHQRLGSGNQAGQDTVQG